MLGKQYTVISTFAGGGGSSLGYHMAGFRELAGVDNEQHAIDTLNENKEKYFKDAKFILKSVEDADLADTLMSECGIAPGELDVLDASPPCQSISRSNTGRTMFNKKNLLFFHVIRLISQLLPKIFVIENVDGLTDKPFRPLLRAIAFAITNLDYRFDLRVLNAKNFGVAQSRKRAFILGVRNDIGIDPVFPKPSSEMISLNQVVSTVDFYSPGQFKDKKHLSKGVCCTVTKSESLKFYRNGELVKPKIEEVMRICSFPDDYILTGSRGQQYARLGNSVPPLMMKAIAETIRTEILDVYYASINDYKQAA